MTMQTDFVTGATGFIAKHIILRLLNGPVPQLTRRGDGVAAMVRIGRN